MNPIPSSVATVNTSIHPHGRDVPVGGSGSSFYGLPYPLPLGFEVPPLATGHLRAGEHLTSLPRIARVELQNG